MAVLEKCNSCGLYSNRQPCYECLEAQIGNIRKAKQRLDAARGLKCICSGFAIQYEGCGCEKAKQKAAAKTKLKELLEIL